MKQYFWVLLLIGILATRLDAHEIIESPTIAQVLPLIDEETWFLVDLDNTVFQAAQALGHVNWLQDQAQKHMQAGKSRQEAFHSLYPLWKKTQRITEVVPVEADFIEAIKELQNQNIVVMGLTHRQLFIVQETLRQLDSIGVSFQPTAPSPETIPLQAKQPALYTQGILFVDDFNSKGELFRSLIQQLGRKPKKVVFIDDKRKNVEEFAQVALQEGIAYKGIYYTAVEQGAPIYSPELAEYQLKCLEEQETQIAHPSSPEYLYKFVSPEDWRASLQQNQIIPSSLDGEFIHLATEDQLPDVLENYWSSQDHFVLKIATKKVMGRLIYETYPGVTSRYYHLYEGAIPLDAIVDVTHFVAPSSAQMRAAIDFGSGAVKIQVAVVDTEENRLLGKPLLSKYTPLGLTEDVASHEGRISEEVTQIALKILHGFKEDALKIAAREGHSSVQFTGIATAVFRKAQNGNELLQLFEEQLGIRFQILPQDEEGKLGFLTANALYPDAPETSLLAWDSGNGSFQMTVKESENYTVYQGPLGHGTVRVLLSKEIRKGPVLQSHESGNPVSREEALALTQKIEGLLPAIPDWLQEKLKDENTLIATFGDGESIFSLIAQALAAFEGQKEPVQQAILTLSDVQKVIGAYLGQDDAVFKAAGLHFKTLTSAVQLSAVMQYFGIQKIHFKRSLGITPGMLIAPQLWDEVYEKATVPYTGCLCAS